MSILVWSPHWTMNTHTIITMIIFRGGFCRLEWRAVRKVFPGLRARFPPSTVDALGVPNATAPTESAGPVR